MILERPVAGEIETRYMSFPVRESRCMPQGGTDVVCRVIIGCVQHNGQKITSANPNGELVQ